MTPNFRYIHQGWLAAGIVALIVAGCSTTRWEDTPQQVLTEDAAAVDLPRSKSGNPPFYEVYGKRYRVLDSGAGYKQRGVASWYGKKFHGRSTSSGETYNMYAMTAAHKTLPLPTNVRVTNLETGKSVILRVNDRGPFVKNRLIDLSYAAAKELDVVTHGTALVEVVALTSASPHPVSAAGDKVNMYLQVGAFGDRDNAWKLANRLRADGIANAGVHEKPGENPPLYRVRIGPVHSVEEFDRLSQQVEMLQIAESHLVVEPTRSSAATANDAARGG